MWVGKCYNMHMKLTRLDQARIAFRRKDLKASKQAHIPLTIARSLHQQESATSSLSEIILGGQDGLVNVLGVILGVAAASGDTRIIVAAGIAAAFAESISMGAVAYTSTMAEAEHYASELKREKWEIENHPQGEREEIRQIYIRRGFSGKLLDQVVEKLTQDKKIWLEVMMNEELKLTPIHKRQAIQSAVIVGTAAIIGSFIPLLPFFFLSVNTGMMISLVTSAVTLFLVGAYKAKITVGKWYKSGSEIAVIGIISALVGYAIGSLFKVPSTP